MNEAERIVTKVSRDFQKLDQLVRGNGTKKGSVLGRLDELEDQNKEILRLLEEIKDRPCREPCLWEEHMKKEEAMREKKRTWRIGDIANYIQLAMLILLVYGFFRG